MISNALIFFRLFRVYFCSIYSLQLIITINSLLNKLCVNLVINSTSTKLNSLKFTTHNDMSDKPLTNLNYVQQ